ncbi:MAG: sugar phosphate isomerase/epimerase family protein [Methanosarcinaceae archaeon]|nr:sugar phosphate isomerase/epimerase family protein [Methanosarcinaceae archaeon]
MIIGASSFAGTIQEIKNEVQSVELYIPKLGLYKNLQLQDGVLDGIMDALSTSDLATSIHAPYFADVPTYPKELVVDTANMDRTHFRLMEESIELANRLNSKVVVIHPGRINGNRALSFSNMVKNLKELASTAHDYGVMLGLENKEGTDPGNLCCNTAELLEAVKAVDSSNLGVTFDVGHANLTCGGVSEKVRKFAKDLNGYVVHIHLHDNYGVWTNEYAGDMHMAPGSGTVDFSVINEISDYRGIYNLEVFSIDDIVSGKNIIFKVHA